MPLDVGIFGGTNTKAGNQRREPARFREKSDAGEFGSGRKHVSLSWYQGAAEILVEEVFLNQLPGNNLAHAYAALFTLRLENSSSSCKGVSDDVFVGGAAFLVFQPPGKKTINDGVFNLVGIALNVADVEPDNAGKIIDAIYVAVDHARFYRV